MRHKDGATRGHTVKLTKNQTTEATIADLYRATDRRHPITITYTKADGTVTIRTIEPYDIRTTRAGAVIVKAMDRQSGESRTFRADRITAYTRHAGATYHVERPADTIPTPVTVTVNTVDQVIAREMAREDRDYWNDRYDHLAA